MQQPAGLFGQVAVSSHSGVSFGASVLVTQSFSQPGYAARPFGGEVVSSNSGEVFGASVPWPAAPKQQLAGLCGQRSHSGSSFGASVIAAPMQSFPQPGYEVMSSPSAGGSSGGSQQTYGHSVKYTMKHKRGGFWLVEFMPLHAGQFTVSAGISGSGMGAKQAEDRYGVTVTGTFNIGGRVRRGPD